MSVFKLGIKKQSLNISSAIVIRSPYIDATLPKILVFNELETITSTGKINPTMQSIPLFLYRLRIVPAQDSFQHSAAWRHYVAINSLVRIALIDRAVGIMEAEWILG
jgi:hypothetical protein